MVVASGRTAPRNSVSDRFILSWAGEVSRQATNSQLAGSRAAAARQFGESTPTAYSVAWRGVAWRGVAYWAPSHGPWDSDLRFVVPGIQL